MGKSMVTAPPPDPTAWKRFHAVEAESGIPRVPLKIANDEDREWQEWEKEMDAGLAELRRQYSSPTAPSRLVSLFNTALLVATGVVVFATVTLLFWMVWWSVTTPIIPATFTGGTSF